MRGARARARGFPRRVQKIDRAAAWSAELRHLALRRCLARNLCCAAAFGSRHSGSVAMTKFSTRARMAALAAPALMLALAAFAGALTASGASLAQPASLEGSWSGGGVVSFASGAREKARCRAQYSRRSSTTYALTATCATPSGRATQSASVRQVGGNSYQGSFFNSEYNVSGTIR